MDSQSQFAPGTRRCASISRWPLADTPYYRALFAREFDTFILTAFRPARAAGYWRQQFSPEDEQAEEDCFASLTRYLLRTYAQTRKTFIIQNWEGDWALRGNFDPATQPTPAATKAMIRWLAARQRGVDRARAEFVKGGARVFHACEVNLVRQAQALGAASVTTDGEPCPVSHPADLNARCPTTSRASHVVSER